MYSVSPNHRGWGVIERPTASIFYEERPDALAGGLSCTFLLGLVHVFGERGFSTVTTLTPLQLRRLGRKAVKG